MRAIIQTFVLLSVLILNSCHSPSARAQKQQPAPKRSLGKHSAELRGAWISDPRRYQWKQVVKDLKNADINTIYINFATAGAAFYPSKHLPTLNCPDPLSNLIREAHANGMKVHAKVITFYAFETPPPHATKLIKEGRVQKDLKGKVIKQYSFPWLNPAQRANQKLMKDVVMEILEKYPVDGIQFDYIRYFETPGLSRKQIADRQKVITSFMSDISREIRTHHPKLPISVAVIHDLTRARVEKGQDWALWCQERLVDYICPMNYTTDLKEFQLRLDKQREIVGNKVPIYPGIASYKMKSAGPVKDQIKITRNAKTGGYVLFAYDPDFVKNILPGL